MTVGQPFTPADVGSVKEGSAADTAGIKTGDVIVRLHGTEIERFEDVQQLVRTNPGVPMEIVVRRDGRDLALSVTPQLTEVKDNFGGTHRIGLLGIGRGAAQYIQRDPFTALTRAVAETWNVTVGTLKAVGEMIVGARGTEELGGPIKIGMMAGEVASIGVGALIGFMAILSINLGLINLFPIPVLDGGHLLFYAAEALRGRPLGQRAQEYGFRIGLALVLTLMVFATWNDIVRLPIFN
jgi:regulator of sigma E protease